MEIILKKDIDPYKYKAIIFYPSLRGKEEKEKGVKKKTIRFGAAGYSDFTIHKNEERKLRYIARHKNKEDWNKSGILTKGFWAYHLLWNKPTIKASIKDIEEKFNVKIKR